MFIHTLNAFLSLHSYLTLIQARVSVLSATCSSISSPKVNVSYYNPRAPTGGWALFLIVTVFDKYSHTTPKCTMMVNRVLC